MKKKILYFIIIAACCSLSYSLVSRWILAGSIKQDLAEKQQWLDDRTHVYFINVPQNLDTIDFKADITLDRTKTIHKLSFPEGGTRTTVQLYDSNYLRKINQKTEASPLLQGSNLNEQVMLDITSLHKGIYFVHYLSCGAGGIFPLVIH